MRTQPHTPFRFLCAGLCAGALTVAPFSRGGAEAPPETKPARDEMPRVVLDGLRAKFPKAEIDKWEREEEEGATLYDVEFRQDGKAFEADIKADGKLDNWEEAIAVSDLPEAVKKTVDAKYPGAQVAEIMRITTVTDSTEALEGYEIVLKRAQQNKVEITVAADGKILEDSGAAAEEAKPKER